MNTLTEKEMVGIIAKNADTTAPVAASTAAIVPEIRDVLIVGLGDGGCNIANAISRKIPNESYVINYNTRKRVLDNNSEVYIYPPEDADENSVDGAGKVRAYSKDIFRRGAHEPLLKNVLMALEKKPNIAYIFVCATTDGGTGSGTSPIAAKLIADNVDIPVIMIGVYPSANEDATAFNNTMQWQTELTKIGLPYMVFDNDQSGPINEVHGKINDYIANVVEVITGKPFGITDISMIDSRNLYMLLGHTGGRINIAVSHERPSNKEDLSDYIDRMINTNLQPLPDGATGRGIFVKGPADLIKRIDSDTFIRLNKYGTPVLHFNHIEEDEEITVAIVLSGSGEPADKLRHIRSTYDDIMAGQKKKTSVLADIMDGMEDPLGLPKKSKKRGSTTNLDALMDL